jgi:quercetin dioxygenase-like cupin family protein
MPQALVVTREQSPPPLAVVGEEITVLAAGERTGSYEIYRQAGPEGSGPPPHRHPWDEAFYVLAGGVEFGVDDAAPVIARTDTLVHVPADTLHWFRFAPGGGEMLTFTSRAGAAAFFTDVARHVSPVDPDLGALSAIAAAHELTIPPPPG